MYRIVQDLRFGLRMMTKSPGFSAIIVLLLALGIGTTSAVYSIVSGVLIRDLPYVDPDRIVKIWETDPPVIAPASARNYLAWKQQNTVFESMSAFTWSELNLVGDGDPERLVALRVSSDLFPLLGVRPELGRSFADEEAQVGRDNVVILSHDLWSRRYGRDTSIIGRTINLNGRSCTVIGIMPKGFRTPLSPVEPTAWVPLAFDTRELEFTRARYLFVLARLKESHTIATARSEMEAIARSLRQLYPDTNRTSGVGLERIQELTVRDVRPALLVLLAAVFLVLLIACVNVAGLLLVRATARQSEVAIRLALGASRAALVRQFLVESALLGLIGGAVGLLVALWMTDLVVAGMRDDLRLIAEIGVDAKAVAFTLTLSLLTSFAFGLAPAIHTANGVVSAALREAGARASPSRRHGRTRNVLVVAEIALSLTLTIGATLLVQSYLNLQRTDPGLDPKHVVTMAISVPGTGVSDGEPALGAGRPRSFFEQLIERVGNLPGVDSVGLVNYLPLTNTNVNGEFSIEGRPWTGQGRPVTELRIASPEFFKTMRMPLRSGRLFTRADDATSHPVAIVNETMARQFWPNESPVGKRMKFDWWPGDDERWLEVVGVVADVRRSIQSSPDPETYLPLAQAPASSVSFVVRGLGDPLSLVPSIRREIAALDSAQAVANVRTMEGVLADSIAQQRFFAAILGLFAAAALLLAGIGVYGVISYQVGQRVHEIGVRMALGARETDIWKLVIATGLRLVVAGVTIGLIASFAVMRLLGSLLYGVEADDLHIFILVSLVLAAVVLVACYLPARRATKVAPTIALRAG